MNIPMYKLFYFAMTLILQDDHLTTGAWATCDPFYYDNLSVNPYCVKNKMLDSNRF